MCPHGHTHRRPAARCPAATPAARAPPAARPGARRPRPHGSAACRRPLAVAAGSSTPPAGARGRRREKRAAGGENGPCGQGRALGGRRTARAPAGASATGGGAFGLGVGRDHRRPRPATPTPTAGGKWRVGAGQGRPTSRGRRERRGLRRRGRAAGHMYWRARHAAPRSHLPPSPPLMAHTCGQGRASGRGRLKAALWAPGARGVGAGGQGGRCVRAAACACAGWGVWRGRRAPCVGRAA